jgi:hypothetical protein
VVVGKLVVDVDQHLVSSGRPKRRPEIGAVRAPGLGPLARYELGRARLEAQIEHLPPRDVRVRGEERRDLELLPKRKVADRAHVRARVQVEEGA